jgi:hypothetical protein
MKISYTNLKRDLIFNKHFKYQKCFSQMIKVLASYKCLPNVYQSGIEYYAQYIPIYPKSSMQITSNLIRAWVAQ